MKPPLAGAVGAGVAVILMYYGVLTAGIPVVLLALWERALRVMPMRVFGFFIVRLKFLAKPLAFWGLMVALVALGALGAWILSRPTRAGARRFMATAGKAFAAAFLLAFLPLVLLASGPARTQLGSRLLALGVQTTSLALILRLGLAMALYAGVFALAVTLLGRRGGQVRSVPAGSTIAGDGGREEQPGGTPGGGVTRRAVLHRGVTLATGALLGTALARWTLSAAGAARAFAQSIFERIKGLPPEVTPNDRFYVVSKNPPGFDPDVDVQRWRLEVAGSHVGRPTSLSYEQLRAMPSMTRYHTLECISNEVGGDLISNARWRGVPLRDVIARAGGVGPKATKISFSCADGYTESIPVADALHADTILAFEMNGEPLPKAHGFPVRLLVPGLFGMKNPKWITKIEPVNYDFQGYWERSGWSDEAVVKTMSKFTTSGSGPAPAGQGVDLGGVAYAGDRGIKSVEISSDDGKTWQAAELKPSLGKYTWVLWAAVWTPAAEGLYTVKVRAREGSGLLQAATPAPTLPDGASGLHTIRIRVRK